MSLLCDADVEGLDSSGVSNLDVRKLGGVCHLLGEDGGEVNGSISGFSGDLDPLRAESWRSTIERLVFSFVKRPIRGVPGSVCTADAGTIF